MSRPNNACTAFAGTMRIAAGGLAEAASAVKAVLDRGDESQVLVFDDATGKLVDIDLRGTADDDAESRRTPGRPKLGVIGREVTLLPRHWAWLNEQPGGASVALRKLVEQARRAGEGDDRVRRSREAAYRFMHAMAGDRAGYEEANRALFAGDRDRFHAMIESWPNDIREYAAQLAAAAFPEKGHE